MEGDIKLDTNRIVVEGDRLDVTAPDIVLDSPARRKAGGGPFRRALVHNADDGLTINFNGDYPQGVRVMSNLTVDGPDLLLDRPERRKRAGGLRRALVHGFNDELVINLNGDYPGGVTIGGDVDIDIKVFAGLIGGPNRRPVPKYSRTKVDLGIVLGELRSQVAALEAKVAELEAKLK